jgi:hypothetical protein
VKGRHQNSTEVNRLESGVSALLCRIERNLCIQSNKDEKQKFMNFLNLFIVKRQEREFNGYKLCPVYKVDYQGIKFAQVKLLVICVQL